MAAPLGRPRRDPVEAIRLRKIKHVAFHQGVQFNGKVYSSLNAEMHEKHNVEMFILDGGCLQVKMDTGKGMEEWIIGSGMWHYAKTELLDPRSDE